MIDSTRQQMETQVLNHYLPATAYRFMDIGTSQPYLMMGMLTNSGKTYTIRIDLAHFPESVPEVYVTKMLYTKQGTAMDSPSASMHTLSSKYGFTRICHYGSNSWSPRVSLYKIFIKCRLWVEIYELHLKTGRPMDYYLNHQS
ncbi:MAG: hypothetical protein K2M55_03665 [Muribaculaceae bacterium]|nr:hypothetical protein [Muribaculaceae bacterium]